MSNSENILQVFAERDVDAEYEFDISAFRAVIDEEEVILAAACDVIDAHINQTEAFNLQPYYRICSLHGVREWSHGQENPPANFPIPS
jgi:hypothetical protein